MLGVGRASTQGLISNRGVADERPVVSTPAKHTPLTWWSVRAQQAWPSRNRSPPGLRSRQRDGARLMNIRHRLPASGTRRNGGSALTTSTSDGGRGGSPPTDRVVAIVEFLAAEPEPSSVATIATRLEFNRSTATAILAALERAGWVERRPDLRYSLGAGLYGVAEAVRAAFPVSHQFGDVLDDLAQRTQCDATLALVGNSTLTFVNVARGHGQVPAGVSVGGHVPLTAPLGAAVIAYRDRRVQERWLDSAAPESRDVLEGLLEHVRQTGVAVFGLGDANLEVLVVLAEVAQMLTEHPRRSALQRQVFDLLSNLAGNSYTAAELASEADLSVSYLSAPVFVDGQPVYEVQLGPLQSAVSPAKRTKYMDEIRSAATVLSR